jgi:glutamate transport system permease protein
MDVLIDELNVILDGFQVTLELLALSAILATVLGTVLAAARVAPIRLLNAIGTCYVNTFRNTPLIVLFVLTFFGLPEVGLHINFFKEAVLALTLYTAAFVCEAVRSGINSVAVGQAEAARAVGMTFGQTLGIIVLPQAFRAVVPPMASVYIALAKNTSIAAGFGVAEAVFQMRTLLNNNPAEAYWLFFGIAMGYIVIVAVISAASQLVERRWAAAAR